MSDNLHPTRSLPVIAFYLLVFLLAACGDPQQQQAQSESGSDRDDLTAQGSDGAFYKRFSGSIGNRAITLHLTAAQGRYTGYYYFNDGGPQITLTSFDQTDSGSQQQLLHEFLITDAAHADQNYWLLTIKNDTAYGSRHTAQQMDDIISLREAYPAGSYPLSRLQTAVQASYTERDSTPFATSQNKLLWPYTTTPEEELHFLRESLLRIKGCPETANPSREALLQCTDQQDEQYFREYRKVIAETEKEFSELPEAFRNYSRETQWTVIYNDRGWLILEAIESEYTGGAHGNYAATYHCLDVQGKKSWKLGDVLHSDTGQLRVLLDIAARNYFGLDESAPLQERLLTDQIDVTDNFYLTNEGIVFCYNPYEIASYADGIVPLFIPYRELKALLHPAFSKRMQLHFGRAVSSL